MNDIQENLSSGYYYCELKSLFHKDKTYKTKCYYDKEKNRFIIDGGDVTMRVVKVIEEAFYEDIKLL